MSKIWGNSLKDDDKKQRLNEIGPTIRYCKKDDSFVFSCLDNLDLTPTRVRIDEVDLLRMIKVDELSEDEQNELYFKRMLKKMEQDNLDDDTYNNVSLLQSVYCVSRHTLTLAKRQEHLYRLGKVDTKEVKLIGIPKRTGRPKGSRNKNIVDERVQYLIDNFDTIAKKCYDRGWDSELRLLEKETHKKFDKEKK